MLLKSAAPVPSGIAGLDAVLHGGFPSGRTAVVVGAPGTGKTVLAMQFLVNGATLFDEPGLMITFEESPEATKVNFPGFAWPSGTDPGINVTFIDGRMPVDAVASGGFDLGGLIAVASSMIERHGIKRVAIDGIDALFSLGGDVSDRRREILRILTWLAEAKLTALLTVKTAAESGEPPGYYDLAEYSADGVLKLTTIPIGELSRRLLTVVKLRGAGFEAGSHPYMITDRGIRVLYSRSLTGGLGTIADARLATGVERLDVMLLGGFRAGTVTLISGSPGASKTTLGVSFLAAGARAGERGLFIGFDEPAEQMIVDVQSVGLDLEPFIRSGLLRAESFTAGGVIGDEHYLRIEALIDEHQPTRVVIDPISAIDRAGGREIGDAVRARLVVLFKSRGITAAITSIADANDGDTGDSQKRVSAIADTWIHLGFANRNGERNRTLTVRKARGTGHSNQVREMVLSESGINLADVYNAGGETLAGTARAEKEQQNEVEREAGEVAFARALDELDRDRESLARSLAEAQRGLDELAEHRAELVKRSAATGKKRAHDLDLIHSLRHGDAEDA